MLLEGEGSAETNQENPFAFSAFIWSIAMPPRIQQEVYKQPCTLIYSVTSEALSLASSISAS